MKRKIKTTNLVLVCLLMLCITILSGCQKNYGGMNDMYLPNAPDVLGVASEEAYYGLVDKYGKIDTNGESYIEIKEAEFTKTETEPKSFFTLDSNTASYANLRRFIINNQTIQSNAIKTDELINYFNYKLEEPTNGETFKVLTELMDCPWNEDHSLITFGVTSKEESLSPNVSNNLVFLIDTSGSMTADNKLPLIKQAFPLMLNSLNPDDTISIVTYASGVTTPLSGCKVANKMTIIDAISGLSAGGSTAGASGIEKAYEVAQRYFISNGNNRIILATDGDFNVGRSSTNDLKELITEKRQTGIYLSVLGLGMGNYHDSTAETLAMNGNGNYAYIDTLNEAKKVLTEDLAKTLIAVAKDVKIQVEFNKDIVDEYRLIGYENKHITEEDFNNTEKDASEVGSGHTTIVVYEVNFKTGINKETLINNNNNQNISTVTINYKTPKDESKTIVSTFDNSMIKEDKDIYEDFHFVTCIVEFSLLLRDSVYKGNANMNKLIARLEQLPKVNSDLYRLEFLSLVKKARENQLLENEQ